MKRVAFFLLAACGGAATTTQTETPVDDSAKQALVEGCASASNQEIIDTDIDGDTTWTKDKVYRLGGVINVVNGTLTIEAGTVVQGTVAQKSALVVNTSGRLVTRGTVSAPVVFTSCKPVGTRAPGDWGGVALLGKAIVNTTDGTNQLEGLNAEARYRYGGQDDTHDCGSLRYTRVEFAGFEFQPDKELNAITFAACGSKTSVDFVQAHQGEDDLMEFFGGSVNVKHVVLTSGNDDGFDWQLGYRGKAQFILYRASKAAGFQQQERCVEADNNEQNFSAEPYSEPTLANITCIGIGKDEPKRAVNALAFELRRGTKGRIVNAIVTNYNGFAFEMPAGSMMSPDPTQTNVTNGSLSIDHALLFNNLEFDAKHSFESSMMVGGSFNLVNADPLLDVAKPAASSPALDAAAAVDVTTLDAFFEDAPFRGAVGSTDWTQGWTSYPEN